MRVLVCHNFYQQPGGEDQVFAAEVELLRAHGHDVRTLELHNDAVASMGKLKLAATTIWNRKSAALVRDAVQAHGSEVVHFHNTFPLFSPSVYFAARRQGAAIVQTLHNYRLLCAAATLYRQGAPCERCLGRSVIPAVKHRCYRDSRGASAVTAAMLTIHRGMGSYARGVDAYIALTHFARRKFIEGGFKEDQLFVKPNFVAPDPGPGPGDGRFALFVGRLTEEKGVAPLLAAWQEVGDAIPLRICGDGPMADVVGEAVRTTAGVQWLGRRPLAEVIDLMGRATMLIFPSLWYEGLPRTIVESFARGTPVIASRLGSLIELIEDGRTGEHFEPGNPLDLAAKVRAMAENSAGLAHMRGACRSEFLDRYGADANHEMLLQIYRQAIQRRETLPELDAVPAL